MIKFSQFFYKLVLFTNHFLTNNTAQFKLDLAILENLKVIFMKKKQKLNQFRDSFI